MNSGHIPKIHRFKTRQIIEKIAFKLADMDGFKVAPTAFEWLQIEPYLRETINPRSIGYVLRAIEILKIMKEHRQWD